MEEEIINEDIFQTMNPFQKGERDVISNQTIVVSNSYTSRKGQTYEELGTTDREWVPCEIVDYEVTEGGFEYPIFEVPIDYELVKTRYTISPIIYGEWTTCNLCGHKIHVHCYIRNDIKKWVMLVGSECVCNHYGRVIQKKMKEFKDNETRIEVKDFLIKYIVHCSTQYSYLSPKTLYEKNQISIDSYIGSLNAQKLLDKFEKVGVRKLSNFMKLHKKELLQPFIKQDLGNLGVSNLKDLIVAFDKKLDLIINFGKYNGMKVSQIDSSYIDWAKENVK